MEPKEKAQAFPLTVMINQINPVAPFSDSVMEGSFLPAYQCDMSACLSVCLPACLAPAASHLQ